MNYEPRHVNGMEFKLSLVSPRGTATPRVRFAKIHGLIQPEDLSLSVAIITAAGIIPSKSLLTTPISCF